MRAALLLFFGAVPLLGAEVLDNVSVVRMAGAGLGVNVIILKIERSQCAFDTSTNALIALKEAHVPDAVIAAMLQKGDASAVPFSPVSISAAPAAAAPLPAPVAAHADPCAAVRFFATGNDGPAWVPSNVCVDGKGIDVDEQRIALADIVAQCMKTSNLAIGGSLLHGDPEWWIGDAAETLKFRGKPEDLDRLASALTHARSDIPHGGCGDRELLRRFVRP
jgi:hypothetical protein